MKKTVGKLLTLCVAFAFVILAIPATDAQAKVSCVNNLTTWVNQSDSNNGITVRGIGNAKLKSVKSSDRSVLNIIMVNYDTYEHEKCANIIFRPKKAGTAYISFKINGKSYSTKIKVNDYVNPVSSAKIFGIKENGKDELKSVTATSGNAWLLMEDGQPSKEVKIKAAKGWKIAGINLYGENYNYIGGQWYRNLKSSATQKFTLPKKDSVYYLEVQYIKTGAGEQTGLFVKYTIAT